MQQGLPGFCQTLKIICAIDVTKEMLIVFWGSLVLCMIFQMLQFLINYLIRI